MAVPTPSRYLVRRAGVLHYRRVVPTPARALAGCRVWKRSLKTGDLREAEARARLLAVEHDELIAKAKNASPVKRLEAISKLGPIRIDPADLEGNTRRLVDRLRETMSARHEAFRTTLKEAEAKLPSLTAAEHKRVESEGGLHSFGVHYLVERDELRMLKAKKRNDQDSKFVIEGRQRDIQERGHILAKLGVSVFETSANDPKHPRLSMTLDPWFAARKQGMSAQRRHRVAMRRFIDLHGDLPVSDITRHHVKEFMAAIEGLADHRRLPAKQRGGLSDPGKDVPRVSAKTVERHLVSIKALLRFAVEQEWCSVNVADAIRPPKDTRSKASKRRPFTLEERRAVLARAAEEAGENSDMAWLIKLGAYTGARLEELCQFASANVREIDGIKCIEIDDRDGRKVKNLGSVRTIPLHTAIRDAFIARVREGKGERVFTSFRPDRDGRYANEASGEFARLMDRAALSDSRLTFHSLRHTLKRAMNDARIDPDVRRAVLGHAARDVHDQYGGGVSLATMATELAKMPPLF